MNTVFVFDADGVVIEPWGFANALERQFSISRDQTKEFFAGPFQKCLVGASDLGNELAPFLSRWNWPGSVQEFIHLWLDSESITRKEVLGRVLQFRNEGIHCCLASNQEFHRARYIESQMGFATIFDRLYFSCDLGSKKPAPEFYRAIAEDLGVGPDCIRFWDDALSHVDGARCCGWNAYLYESIESVSRDV